MKNVVDARIIVPFNQRGVVVLWFAIPLYEDGVNIHGFVSVMVPPRATDPPPVRPLPAETVRAPALVRRELPMVEVDTTLPLLSVERSALARLENHWFVVVNPVVVAETNATVFDADRENGEPLSHNCVVVDWTATP